ncbi:MAG: DUF4412 domain-containing protein [Balneolales bacterium]
MSNSDISCKIYCIALLTTVLLCLPAIQQTLRAQQFEGSISYTLEADGEEHDFVYFMKDDHARVEFSSQELGGDLAILINSAPENLTILMDQLSLYMNIPIPKDEESEGAGDAENFHLTGEKSTISGYECQQYIYTDDDGSETEIWTPVNADFGNFIFPKMAGNSIGSLKQPNIPAVSFFPFLMVTGTGKDRIHMEVIFVEEKRLNNSLFSIPANYREMNMPMFGN